MKIQKLLWDSDFFFLNIGKLVIHDNEKFHTEVFNNLVEIENYDLVYVYSMRNMLTQEDILNSNLELVDIQITMTRENFTSKDGNNIYNFKNFFSKKELDAAYRIAEQTAAVSRFFNDPLIGKEKTINLYKKWIDNTLDKTFGSGILAEYNERELIGINLIKTDIENKIGLCSVIGVEQKFQGRGIGKALWKQAFSYWLNETDIQKCRVNFSLKNTNSFNFHLRMGFNITEDVKFIYHYRKNQ